MKFLNAELWLFIVILVLLWFTNKQHDHIVYLEDTIKVQDQAISQQAFVIECQKVILGKNKHLKPESVFPFYKKYD